ncbi:unnamed protein product [Eruca vesicaria subsp. sativa]|uniref:Uncharacterized protein n=1 Tax=Eruca vesicaria subsp. sativa TaxID=29727 RepID=A0ABC8LY20_ERUVS|nr:unnamed protein product [Eruca vesicaria subsp. sativa]
MPDVPSGCPSAKQFSNYLHERVRECILRYMSKKETATHLLDRYQIAYGFTVLAWCNIERSNQEFFKTYFEDGVPNAKARAKMGKVTALNQIEEDTGSCKTTPNSPPKGDSNKAPSLSSDKRAREKEQQLIETVRNILSKVPQEDANAHDGNPKVIVEQSSIKAGESQQARQKQTLQATRQQQLTFPTAEYWNKLLTSLGRIQSNTDQIVKLMTDAPPHSSAAGSFKRQRVEPEKEGSEAKKLQDQNIQLQEGKSRGNKAAKID